MGEQRGLAPLLTVDLAPVTVELNLRESGARFPCKWSSVLEIYSYAGLLTCRECGNTFIPMIRCWNGKSRVEYVCRGYHRNGKAYCSSHRIREEVLDAEVQACAETVREQCVEEVEKLAQLQKMWALRRPILDAHILSLQEKVLELEQEIDGIVMEKIRRDF